MGVILISKPSILISYVKHIFQTHGLKHISAATRTKRGESLHISEKPQNGQSRDMSKLHRQNRNVLMEIMPYNEPCSWIHLTENYKRKMFGRYGLASNIDPYICFSMRGKSDSFNSVKEPYSFDQLILNVNASESNRNKDVVQREQDIAEKLVKLEQWKVEMRKKMSKKEAEMVVLKEQKQRLMEEVRRHFGFKVDPRDDRFKEMLEQKEREEKKKQKEAKRRAREEKMMTKLAEKTSHYQRSDNVN